MTDVDQTKLNQLSGKAVGDIASALGVFMAYLGDQAGVYKVMDEAGPMTAPQLAKAAGLNPKYLHEWLGANAAAGYVTFEPSSGLFSLSPEQALVFTREGQPACLQGFFQAVVSQFETQARAVETFKSGKGRPWGEHSGGCFCGVDRFFRPGYQANLIESWIPALEGAKAKLEKGARVADIGCGHGSSSILLAKAYPNSTIHGFDFHEASILKAREHAKAAGVKNVRFEVAKAQDFSAKEFDLAFIFDALHDMGDPVGAARHIRQALKPGGLLMLVEPMAGDRMADNLNPIGQIYYALSTTICTPTSLSQEVGLGLGAQAGQKRLTGVLNEAGFGHVRRVAETPTNMVLEARA